MAPRNKRTRDDQEETLASRKRPEIVSVELGGASDNDVDDLDFDSSDEGSDGEGAAYLATMGRKELLLRAEAAEDEGAEEEGSDIEEQDQDQEQEDEDEDEDEEDIDQMETQEDVQKNSKPAFRKNKQRVLLLSSRGITERYRHLLKDLGTLMPHSKKESKLDSKHQLNVLNELAELSNCNNCLYFEIRKHTDLYMWMSKTPNGPSVKFHVQNVHTMDELRMTGNCLKGSRPILSFDKNFDDQPHYQLLKEMFTQTFGSPRTSRKLKPFIDHVLSFSIADDKIWFRNYQVVEKAAERTKEKEISLIEIGPRFVLSVMRVFDGSFGGSTLFENREFVSPNEIRRTRKHQLSQEYRRRVEAGKKKEEKLRNSKLPEDPLADVFK
ncbi:hypothetical protein SpCBS45565_g00201 [Spizellomyces sp. 'palustris']|nr:hypothetical protein SpCBS45565_g00201 [Spizellomyces sp. 'palustris']